jgi:hypothetical protein
MRVVAEHYHQEYIYQFLMELNDSFASIWGQILLIEPLPFYYVIQEEKQQEISVKSLSHESIALVTKSTTPMARFVKQPYRKDKPICTHCGVFGHTAEKCYRLHGFPPGFKFTKNLNKSSPTHSANHVYHASANMAGSIHASSSDHPPLASNSSQISGYISHLSNLNPKYFVFSSSSISLLLSYKKIPNLI